MKRILGDAKTVKALLSNVKYSIDYYQREYKWEEKQVAELITDLTGKFLESYDPLHSREKVEEYTQYFLGSIIISERDGRKYIIDGQQRLTSLTLLLIFLNNLQNARGSKDQVPVEVLIYSTHYGRMSFNIDVEERRACMEALFKGDEFDANDQPESVQNILTRYANIEQSFPEDLRDRALPYFIDWLEENVYLVEITATSDEDAYTIFETMNDRGLSLTPVDMLKGYLLAHINDSAKRASTNNLWKKRVQELMAYGKDTPADCIKSWLRSQYAEKIRERKRDARPEDFDLIGTEFHRWVRDNQERLGLRESCDFVRFVERDFVFFSKQYLRLMDASQKLRQGLDHVFHNAQYAFTLQYMILLAPVKPDDTPEIIDLKFRLVSTYLDILIARRIWNYREISYATMRYSMFPMMRDIRHKDPFELAHILREKLDDYGQDFAANERLALRVMNRGYIQRILARLTDYVGQKSGLHPQYLEYTTTSGRAGYEVEHIWANHPDRYKVEFPHHADFAEYRNRIGGLLLLPRSFNASYGDLTYEDKLPHYFGQNILAKSLHSDCYNHNPNFIRFAKETGLPFKPYSHFKKADLDERQNLYRIIAEQVWNPALLTDMVDGDASL